MGSGKKLDFEGQKIRREHLSGEGDLGESRVEEGAEMKLVLGRGF